MASRVLLWGWSAQVRRVDGVLPSEVLSVKYQVAWTRPGRLAFGKIYYLPVYLGTIPTVPYLSSQAMKLPRAERIESQAQLAGAAEA